MVLSMILRLPCKNEGSFSVIQNKSRLINHIVANHTVKTVDECHEKCEDNKKCKSVNHKKFGHGNCQLNSRIKEEGKWTDMLLDDQWTYYATDYRAKNVRRLFNMLLQIAISNGLFI